MPPTGLTSLDLSRNELGAPEAHAESCSSRGGADEPSDFSRLLRVLSRLPNLTTLNLKQNAVMQEPKARERLVLGCAVLSDLDGKLIEPAQRRFLQGMVAKQHNAPPARKPRNSSDRLGADYAGRTRHVGPSRAPARELDLKAHRAAGQESIARGLSIQPVANFEIPFGGLDGTLPQVSLRMLATGFPRPAPTLLAKLPQGLTCEQNASAALPSASQRPQPRLNNLY